MQLNHIFSQDANECWTEIVRSLQQKLKPIEAPPSAHEPMVQYGAPRDSIYHTKLQDRILFLPLI